MLTIGSLFSGIGGLELGLEWAGLGPVLWQVEQDAFCQLVLAKHWPYVERFDDVRTVGAANLRHVDLICGGFPCQDVSQAGQKAGIGGSRSGLWSEFARIIGELRPRFVVVENVADLALRGLDVVLADLSTLGFDAVWLTFGAENLGAPHRRRRLFVVAYSHAERREALPGIPAGIPDQARDEPPWAFVSDRARSGRLRRIPDGGICRVADGRPSEVDIARIERLGNAVVPQCAEVVGWVIRELAGLRFPGLQRD